MSRGPAISLSLFLLYYLYIYFFPSLGSGLGKTELSRALPLPPGRELRPHDVICFFAHPVPPPPTRSPKHSRGGRPDLLADCRLSGGTGTRRSLRTFRTFSSSRYAPRSCPARLTRCLPTTAQPEQRLRLRPRPFPLRPVRCPESRPEGQRLPYCRPHLRGYEPQTPVSSPLNPCPANLPCGEIFQYAQC